MAEVGDPIPRSSGPRTYRKVVKELGNNQYRLAHVQLNISRFLTP
jgi:hypothetical protein